MKRENIIILDTTLRDGDQSPGFSLGLDEKIIIAGHLERLGVDIIEAGFPASSKGQFTTVQRIAGSLRMSAISAMARARTDDIKKAGEAIAGARVKKYIHTTIATSPIHRKMKLRKSRSEIIDIAVEAVLCASQYADYVEIGAEDATRTEPEFLMEFCEMVTDAGADVVNIADTVGFIQPQEFFMLILKLYNNVKAFKTGKARISVHCHNDLGQATSNTLSGLMAGGLQAEVTLLGIGERGGNTPLEEIAAVLKTRDDYYGKIKTRLNPEFVAETVRDLSIFTGVAINPNKPVTGSNVFTHSSGIHQNGMLASPLTYSVLNPEQYGFQNHRFILSRHSGLSGFNAKINELTGDRISVSDDQDLFNRFKYLADTKNEITTTDVLTFLFDEGIINNSIWYLDSWKYSKHINHSLTIEVSSVYNDHKKVRATGATKWSVAESALKSLFRLDINLIYYSFSGSSGKTGSNETFFIAAEYEGMNYADELRGNDSLELFIKSYLNLINQISAKFQLSGL